MSWIEDYIKKNLVKQVVAKLVKWLDGKKTATGALSLLLWVAIYAIPAFTPDYNWITQYATMIRDALNSSGVVLDNTLFNVGTTFTVVGLLDKLRKLIRSYKEE